jgi:ribosomal protein S21
MNENKEKVLDEVKMKKPMETDISRPKRKKKNAHKNNLKIIMENVKEFIFNFTSVTFSDCRGH